MIGQLAFANVMSIQNLSLQHSQLRATNANTAAVSKAGSRVAASVDQAGRQVVNALHQLSQ